MNRAVVATPQAGTVLMVPASLMLSAGQIAPLLTLTWTQHATQKPAVSVHTVQTYLCNYIHCHYFTSERRTHFFWVSIKIICHSHWVQAGLEKVNSSVKAYMGWNGKNIITICWSAWQPWENKYSYNNKKLKSVSVERITQLSTVFHFFFFDFKWIHLQLCGHNLKQRSRSQSCIWSETLWMDVCSMIFALWNIIIVTFTHKYKYFHQPCSQICEGLFKCSMTMKGWGRIFSFIFFWHFSSLCYRGSEGQVRNFF